MIKRIVVTLLVSTVAALSSGCHDTCFLVVGCRSDERLAVDGRLLQMTSGLPERGVGVTLRASFNGVDDSTRSTTDDDGLFHLELPGLPDSGSAGLTVRPEGNPGYVLRPLPCHPVTRRGDACVLDPLAVEPRLPAFAFAYRAHPDQPAANISVQFTRTGGADLFGPDAGRPMQAVTDASGIAELFAGVIFATSLDPVVGDLTVDLPPPVGRMVRHGYLVQPSARFDVRDVVLQRVGPTISYRMLFVDSTSGVPLPGVVVRLHRTAGVALEADTATVVSDKQGLAFLAANPIANGTVTESLSITPARSLLTTVMQGVVLPTFDADSSVELSRWKVGTTGLLYPLPPGGP